MSHLEDELQGKLHSASIAVEGRFGIQEVRLSRSQIILDAGASLTKGTNIVQDARRELRMVENIERLRLEFQFGSFRDVEALYQRRIPIIDVLRGDGVPTRSGEGSGSSNQVLGIGILRQIRHYELGCTDGISARVGSRPTTRDAIRWSGRTGISAGA